MRARPQLRWKNEKTQFQKRKIGNWLYSCFQIYKELFYIEKDLLFSLLLFGMLFNVYACETHTRLVDRLLSVWNSNCFLQRPSSLFVLLWNLLLSRQAHPKPLQEDKGPVFFPFVWLGFVYTVPHWPTVGIKTCSSDRSSFFIKGGVTLFFPVCVWPRVDFSVFFTVFTDRYSVPI